MDETLVFVLPGGNPTTIVGDWAYLERPDVFVRLMRDTQAEQAGSIRVRKGVVHLRMMGWEFSLNGLVAAAIASQAISGERARFCSLVCDLGDDHVDAIAELTWQGPISAIVRLQIENFWSRVVTSERDSSRSMVHMKGIAHSLISTSSFQQARRSLAKRLIDAERAPAPARTVLFHSDLDSDVVDLEPYVYVRDVRSFVRETSCGSGAVALGMAAFALRSIKQVHVRQPSGTIVKVEVALSKSDRCNWSVSYETVAHATLGPVLPEPLA